MWTTIIVVFLLSDKFLTHYFLLMVKLTFEELKQRVGKNIMNARVGKGLKQTNLAIDLGVSSSFICRIEAGSVNFTFKQLCSICNQLDVSVESVFLPVKK